MSKYQMYTVTEEGVKRKSKFCPRCGSGVFMAEHVDRWHCGRCGFTEFKKGVPKFRAPRKAGSGVKRKAPEDKGKKKK